MSLPLDSSNNPPEDGSPFHEESSLSNTKMRLIEARMLEESYGMGEPTTKSKIDSLSTNENSSLTSNKTLPSELVGAASASTSASVPTAAADNSSPPSSSAALQLAYNMGKSSVGGVGGQPASPSLKADPNEILAEMTSSLATLGDWKKSREKSIEEYAAMYSARLDEGEERKEGEGEEGSTRANEQQDSEIDAILLSCDVERQEVLNGTMDRASNLQRMMESSKSRRGLPPPPSMTVDESIIESGEAKLEKLRLDLQCEEWGRSTASAVVDANAVARLKELEAELLEMETMEAKGAGGGIEMMDDELTLVLKKLDALETPRSTTQQENPNEA
ncbi:hypothetical protein TrCOL_g13383 [Triparma columacea]|uniref:Fibrous sheath-interacting protein 1 n=1 Tax=Triparma columacea TaxID=722753 RepID=A0A9W7GH70_9STRA|nr:hypothetical protein TrCOL_g13383 [Triparma columacea]